MNISPKIIELLSERLKNARESKSLNISSISNRIRVREEFLWAMENGNWSELPPGVHGRGLIRLYAKELSVSVSEMDSSQRTGDDDTPISHSSLSHFLGIKTSPKKVAAKPVDSYMQPQPPSKPLLPHVTPSFMSIDIPEPPLQPTPQPLSQVAHVSTAKDTSLSSSVQLPRYKEQILKTNHLFKSLLPFFFTYKKWIFLSITLVFTSLIIFKTHVLSPVTLTYMEETPVMSQSPKLEPTVTLEEKPEITQNSVTLDSAKEHKEQIMTQETASVSSPNAPSLNKSFLEIKEMIQVQIIADGKIIKSGKQEIGFIPLEFDKTLTLLIEDGSKVNLNFKGWELGPLAKNKRKRKIILHNKDFTF